MPQPRSGHPLVVAYVVALTLVWIVTILTWTVRSGASPEIAPIAQALQYLLVLVSSTVTALGVRRAAPAAIDGAIFGFYDLRWTVPNDAGGQAFWRALGVGIATMLVNIALLIVADAVIGARDAGTYRACIGGGLAVGALLGLAGAVVASVLAMARRRGAPT
jgi:hypothetical protein